MAKDRYFPAFEATLPRADNKVFAITGTTSGTGFVAARTAAAKGGTVILLNRKSKRADEALQKLTEAVPKGEFVPIECDLQDFASVRAAAAKIKKSYNKLYALCNNAGIGNGLDTATVDGYDEQMQTNHLSHFLLTAELYPLLEAEAAESGDARIVNHSSDGRYMTNNGTLEEKYLGRNGGNLGGNTSYFFTAAPMERYCQSKLANSVFTQALAQKLEARNSAVRAMCAHPGGSQTNFINKNNIVPTYAKLLFTLLIPFMQSPADGAMGILTGMLAANAKSGVLYGPRGWFGIRGNAVPNMAKPCETDPKSIAMLWRMSEAATGVTFNL